MRPKYYMMDISMIEFGILFCENRIDQDTFIFVWKYWLETYIWTDN